MLPHLYHIKVILCIVFAMCAALMMMSINVPAGDFGNYYYGSRFLTEGSFGSWIYDPATFNLAVYETGEKGLFLNYTPVPPLSALVYTPFAFLPLHVAKLCWNVIGIALFLFTFYRFHTLFKVRPVYILLISALFFFPIKSNIYQGQAYLLLLFLLNEGLIAYMQERKWLCALCWSFCIHLKIFPAIVLMFIAAEKQWKLIAYIILCLVAGVLICLPFTGTGIWITYMQEILPRLGRGEINHTYAASYQSMQVLLKKLFVPDAMHNPDTWKHAPVAYQLVQGLFNMVVLIAAWTCHKHCKNVLASFAVWITAAMLISGYGSSYSLVLLAIPAIYVCISFQGIRLWIMALIILLIAALPLSYFYQLSPVWQFPRLYLLSALFICLMIRLNTWRFFVRGLWFIPLAALWMLKPFYAGDPYFLKKEEALLVYDYRINPDHVVLFFYDEHGPQQKKTGLPYMVTSVKEYAVESISSEAPGTRVRKASLLNGTKVIYLSDQNRGVGFYTLRTFDINE